MLNKQQQFAFEILKSGKNTFITGGAGTGKTYLLKHYINYISQKKNIIPIGVLSPNSFIGRIPKPILEADVIIIDEISMCSRVYCADKEGFVTDSDCPTDYKLELIVGMRVMALTNHPNGLYQNGSIGMIKSLNYSCATVDFNGIDVFVEPFKWEVKQHQVQENPLTQ